MSGGQNYCPRVSLCIGTRQGPYRGSYMCVLLCVVDLLLAKRAQGFLVVVWHRLLFAGTTGASTKAPHVESGGPGEKPVEEDPRIFSKTKKMLCLVEAYFSCFLYVLIVQSRIPNAPQGAWANNSNANNVKLVAGQSRLIGSTILHSSRHGIYFYLLLLVPF